MIAALVSTAAMSVGAVATSVGAHPLVASAAYGTALVLLLVRPRSTDRVDGRRAWPTIVVAAVAALAAGSYLVVASAVIGGTRYHSDAVVAAHAGAERVLTGRNPYDGFDLVAELARFGLPPTYATPLEDGTRLRSLQYPALAVLVPAPFIALGLPDVRVLYLVEVLAVFGIVFVRAPVPLRPLALALCVGNLVVLDQFVNAGVDPLWALLVLATWLGRLRRWSAIALGLAIATRQPAWLVAPFVIAWTWRALGANEASARAAIAVAVALAVHAPFLLTAPAAVIGGVLTPALLPLEAWGVGPAKLLADTVGPVVPRAAFLVAAAAAYVVGLWAFASGRAIRGALILPLVPLWLSWRALQSYFALLPLFAAVDEGYDRADARR